MNADGAIARSFRRAAQLIGGDIVVVDQFDRALLSRTATGGDEYCAAAVSAAVRREWRRQRRRLSELGHLEVRSLSPGDDAAPWIEEFLSMEAKGWKGRSGNALLRTPRDATCFRHMCAGAHQAGRFHSTGLYLNGEPVALQNNILTAGCDFAMRVAYDEAFSKYSPGVLLELENIAQMFRRPDFVSMRSCSRPS